MNHVYKECEGKDKSVVRDELSSKIIQLEAEIGKHSQDRNLLNNEIETDRKRAQELRGIRLMILKRILMVNFSVPKRLIKD